MLKRFFGNKNNGKFEIQVMPKLTKESHENICLNDYTFWLYLAYIFLRIPSMFVLMGYHLGSPIHERNIRSRTNNYRTGRHISNWLPNTIKLVATPEVFKLCNNTFLPSQRKLYVISMLYNYIMNGMRFSTCHNYIVTGSVVYSCIFQFCFLVWFM